MAVHYLWLVPEERCERQFAALISSLSRCFSGPTFDPHVTLLGSMDADGDALADRMRGLAGRLPPLSLHPLAVSCLNDYYRSLFVDLELGPQLGVAREEARRAFEVPFAGRPYTPHLSLYYGELAAPLKQQLCEELREGIPPAFTADRLRLVAGGARPGDWREVLTLDLGGALAG
jgi:putative hydrolase of the HAD superfamily